MRTLSCATTRRRMSAFCDGELELRERIAVETHLGSCDACAAEADAIREVGAALRTTARAACGGEEGESDIDLVGRSVLPRVKAERNYSFAHRFEESFDDMHLVWAAICSMLAMGAATALLLSFVHQAAQPESLAALVQALSRESASRLQSYQLELPRVYPDAVMPATAMNQLGREDAVFALAAVVTRDGSLSEIELLVDGNDTTERTETTRRLTYDLLDAASTARFEPARQNGAPVALNVVWVLTRTTVRGAPAAFPIKPAPAVVPPWRPIGWTLGSGFEPVAALPEDGPIPVA